MRQHFFLATRAAIAMSLMTGIATVFGDEITSCRTSSLDATFFAVPAGRLESQDKATSVASAQATLAQREDGGFDILFIGRDDHISSLRRSGFDVQLAGISPWRITLAVLDADHTVTGIYMFYRDEAGADSYGAVSMRQATGGSSGVTWGSCDPIRFDLLK